MRIDISFPIQYGYSILWDGLLSRDINQMAAFVTTTREGSCQICKKALIYFLLVFPQIEKGFSLTIILNKGTRLKYSNIMIEKRHSIFLKSTLSKAFNSTLVKIVMN